jgi:hypothetical protein
MSLRTAAERVRAEIAACDYRDAICMLEDFRIVAEESWRAAVTAEQRQQVSSEVQELLQWARTTVLAAQSHQRGKLLQFTRARVYLSDGVGKRDQLELNA